MVAVMGPSGAGKTTFLNALTGRVYYADTTGDVRVNGQNVTIESLKNNVGFVPQDDIVHGDLTVRENLHYSACLRLPEGTSPQRRDDIVNNIIIALGMTHIADSIVGGVEKRGISGGQRKRVNIGLELVATPSLVFLDEPTSGLDASAATELVTCLSNLCRFGYSCIAVIHQPRVSVFTMFDDVLFLGVGG